MADVERRSSVGYFPQMGMHEKGLSRHGFSYILHQAYASSPYWAGAFANTQKTKMKKIISSIAIALGLAVAANAGTATITQDHPVYALGGDFGTGFYMGLQAGVNACHEEAQGLQSEVGGVGGIKAGYVYGNEFVRPTLEADIYYNGFSQSAQGTEVDVDSGAFMANFLVRFALDRFQPYVGGGIGAYCAESTVTSNGMAVAAGAPTMMVRQRDGSTNNLSHGLGAGDSRSGFAWQLVAGADFYFTPTVSIFGEYKFLNYNNTDLVSNDLQQQLVVLGVRMHF